MDFNPRSLMENIPNEVQHMFFEHMPEQRRIALSRVCKLWAFLIKSFPSQTEKKVLNFFENILTTCVYPEPIDEIVTHYLLKHVNSYTCIYSEYPITYDAFRKLNDSNFHYSIFNAIDFFNEDSQFLPIDHLNCALEKAKNSKKSEIKILRLGRFGANMLAKALVEKDLYFLQNLMVSENSKFNVIINNSRMRGTDIIHLLKTIDELKIINIQLLNLGRCHSAIQASEFTEIINIVEKIKRKKNTSYFTCEYSKDIHQKVLRHASMHLGLTQAFWTG